MLSKLGENCGEVWIKRRSKVSILLWRNNLGWFFHFAVTAPVLSVPDAFPHASKQKPALSREPDIGGPGTLQTRPHSQLRPSPAAEP
jgi:hypothetical protein